MSSTTEKTIKEWVNLGSSGNPFLVKSNYVSDLSNIAKQWLSMRLALQNIVDSEDAVTPTYIIARDTLDWIGE